MMKKVMFVFAALLAAACLIGAVSAADSVGGDRGIIKVYSNVDGATVELYSVSGLIETKTISGGSAEFYVYSTGTPANRVVVSADGYYSNGAAVTNPPSGQRVEYTVNLEPKPVGGNVGFLKVTSNVVGAKVEVYSNSNLYYTDYTNAQGVVEFAITVTGTPITHIVVSANGWSTATQSVAVPASGQTETVSVTLTSSTAPTVPTTAVPTPTKTPMTLAVVGLVGALGAAALLRKE